MAKSLQSTRWGLELFLESLERSGFPEAVRAYQQLHLVLLHQRLWARAHCRRELEALFEAIRAAAGSIQRRLSELAAVMEDVRRLDEPPLAVTAKDGGGPAAALLEGLLARVSLSLWSVEQGAGAEGRSYRLSPVACRGLALWLCEPVEQRRATSGAP